MVNKKEIVHPAVELGGGGGGGNGGGGEVEGGGGVFIVWH